jgi:hypothetical protein
MILRKIPAMFLFIAGVAIMAHMIIPHDHHISDSFISQDDACPASTEQSHQKSGIPVHCHVCNELTCEKASVLVAVRCIDSHNLSAHKIFDQSELKVHFVESGIYDFVTVSFKGVDSEFSSLRAPPSFC